MERYFALTGLIRWFRHECEVCCQEEDDEDFDPTDTGHSQCVAGEGHTAKGDDAAGEGHTDAELEEMIE